jgi:methylmalonyl-CoA mutase N-terminal domain/subunit
MNDQTTLSADEQAEIDRAARIAEQNDRFRKTWGADFTVPGQIVVTHGVASLSASAQVQIMRAVQTFDTFTEDNDPYGDHTFGAFEAIEAGETVKLFWKIDLYDTEYTFGSAVPEDTTTTRRVLTIMQRSEY